MKRSPLSVVVVCLASGILLGARPPVRADGAVSTSSAGETSVGGRVGPKTWLWAWERPEDLRFLGGRSDVGVAYLARTVTISGERASVYPRRQPLHVEPGTPLTAVVRLEVPRGVAPMPAVLDRATHEVISALPDGRVRRLQIDYDVRASEESFYRELLVRVRAALPSGTWLSITSIAANCLDERSWLAKPPPVDEVVPMFFTLGPDTRRVRLRLALGDAFPVEVCRGELGVSVDELAIVGAPRADTRTLHAFSASAWTPASFASLPENFR